MLPGSPRVCPEYPDVIIAQRRSAGSFVRSGNRPKARTNTWNGLIGFPAPSVTLLTLATKHKMKDPRQGAAAIVFLVFYLLAFAFTLFCLFTRRAKRHIFSVFIFNLIRIGANIASLGWAIHLYDNFDWLIASLILGTEGELVDYSGQS